MNEFLSWIHLNLSDATLLLIAIAIIELFIIFLLLRKIYKKHHLPADKITETITDADTRNKPPRMDEFIESYGKEKTDVKISTEIVSGVPVQHVKSIDSKVTESIIAADTQRKPTYSLPEGLLELLRDLNSTNSSEHIDQEKLNKLDSFLHQELYPLITKAGVFEDTYDICSNIDAAHQQWRSILLKPWIKDKTTIALLGRFSSGKSSIINSLLGDKLLPVDVTPTTAVPAYISLGSKFVIKAVDNDGNIKNIRPEIFNLLTKDALPGFPIARLIKHFVIEYKNNSLKNKSILDTPGYDSLDEIDKHRALQVIKESNAVFWVMDINDGDISKDALNFIKDNLDDIPLYLLLNKADTKSPGENKKVLAKVTATLKKADVKFENCELYSNRDRGYTEQLLSVLSKVQSSDSTDYKKYVIEMIAIILDSVNKFVAQYKKDLIELEKMKDESERDKEKAIKNDSKYFDGRPIDEIFPEIEGGFFVDLKIKNQEAFLKRFNKIISSTHSNWSDIGREETNIFWITKTIEERSEELKQKEELRTEAHKVKSKAKNIFEEVL